VPALALVAAGCGGDDDDTSTTASLTKAEFLKQGNAICAAGNQKIDAGFEEYIKKHDIGRNEEPTPAQMEELAETVLLPQIKEQVEGVKSLPAPSGDEADVEAIVTAAEEAIEKAEDDPASIATEGSGPFGKANALARDYGLTVCGGE
jgi:hypothetical protein